MVLETVGSLEPNEKQKEAMKMTLEEEKADLMSHSAKLGTPKGK